VDGLEASATAIEGYTDGLEGKLDTLHTDVGTTLHGDVDQLEGYVDGLETQVEAWDEEGKVKRISGSKANDDGTAITLDTGVINGHWGLVCVRALQSGGTATTSRYAIAEAVAASPPDIDTGYRATGTTAKGSLVNDNFVQPIPVLADGSGYLYLFSGRDANNDSTFAYKVTLHKRRSA
jgi:hypothetical protein